MDNIGNTMPSKSVSFSEDGYFKLMKEKPDDMNFSDWIETLAVEALNNRPKVQPDEQNPTETN